MSQNVELSHLYCYTPQERTAHVCPSSLYPYLPLSSAFTINTQILSTVFFAYKERAKKDPNDPAVQAT